MADKIAGEEIAKKTFRITMFAAVLYMTAGMLIVLATRCGGGV